MVDTSASARGPQFTRFTSTKVLALLVQKQRERQRRHARVMLARVAFALVKQVLLY
jgi:hypothetical protein